MVSTQALKPAGMLAQSPRRDSLEGVHERGDRDPEGYGLTRKGGVKVTLSGGKVDKVALGTAIPRFVVRKGKVVAGTPLALR